ncbi:MAG: CocE/NonD family hydrolase [Actinomycetota bacterium]|nr:CocE/NonD family hydrolase [Actinomycetota bacterium]
MRRLALVALLPLLFLLPGTGHATSGWAARPADAPGVYTQRDVRIKMRDDVRLSANVLFPAGADGVALTGRFPVLLTQTPYNKNGLSFASNYLVQRSYIQVIVEVRGTGSSEGHWKSFDDAEQLDAMDILDWIEAQPWYDASKGIGLHGTSYGAINQFMTAERLVERGGSNPVKAMFPIVPMADAYRDITGSGGQVNTSFIPSWLGLVTGLGLLPPTYYDDPTNEGQMYADHAQGATDFQANTVLKATSGDPDWAFDSPEYRTRSPIEKIGLVNVPTFIIGGWFDLFQRGEPLLFQNLQANGAPVKLLMGPWYHTTPSINPGLPTAGMPYTLDQLELRWMDRYVRGIADPNLDTDIQPVTYWTLGENGYGTAQSWPIGTNVEQLFLHGPASALPGGLSGTSPAVEQPDTLMWSPASGACTRSTVQWTAGSGQYSPCETDNEFNDATGLNYQIANPAFRVGGPMAAHLYVSTTVKDAFLTARVEDVDANGRASQISAGWNVLSLRAIDDAKSVKVGGLYTQPYHPFTLASQETLTPGTIYDVWIEIFPSAAMFAPGHSMRLSIQSADAPHLTAPLPQEQNLAGGTITLYHDADHPSSLVMTTL